MKFFYPGVVTLVADMIAICIVALSRCFDTIMRQKWTEFCDKKRNLAILFSVIWIPSLIALLNSFIIEWHGIVPGWHCETGGCGFIRTCGHGEGADISAISPSDPGGCNAGMEIWRLAYFSTICVPTFSLIVIAISYLTIWCKVHRSTRYFVNGELPNLSLSQRDIKMTHTILILVVLNFMCWLPYVVLVTVALDYTSEPKPSTAGKYILKIILICCFESQYALNFFIYVARSEQYRNAFLDVIPLRWKRQSNSTKYNDNVQLHKITRTRRTI